MKIEREKGGESEEQEINGHTIEECAIQIAYKFSLLVCMFREIRLEIQEKPLKKTHFFRFFFQRCQDVHKENLFC